MNGHLHSLLHDYIFYNWEKGEVIRIVLKSVITKFRTKKEKKISQQVTDAREGMEKRKPSCTIGWNVI